MISSFLRSRQLIIAAAIFLFLQYRAAPAVRAAEAPVTFEKDIRPILKTWCLDCHGSSEKPKGKLDLRLRRFAVQGGKDGPAIIPGKPADSLLVTRMRAGEMPPGKVKVPPEKIALIEKWIAAGAPVAHEEPVTLAPGIGITAEERGYWFYKPLLRPAVPLENNGRIRTPVDAFVAARLREKNLTFNPDADKLTLIRRATLDLTGLPPTQAEIDSFLADPSGQAYEKLVDRLLASPAYGERWARHWLDVAGYAESDGDGTSDTLRPYAWKYRDYVIRSLNADKPVNQFVVEQLAGDELLPAPLPSQLKPEHLELLTATGFLRMAPDGTSSSTAPADIDQVITDTLKIVSSSLLGLTVGCAQCHDHRYDPISQTDYFRLRAVFEPAFDPTHWRQPGHRRISLFTDADRAKSAAIDADAAKMQAEHDKLQATEVDAAFEKELAKFQADQREKLRLAFKTADAKRTEEQKKLVATNPKLNINGGVLYQYNQPAADKLKQMQAKIDARRAEKPVEDFIAVCNEVPGQVPVTRLFHRGDYRQPLDEVKPGDLTIAAEEGKRFDIPDKEKGKATTGRRLAFARHLTNGQHPLFGRVFVNRIWLHHFGRGIVDTPGDFGILGNRPTHPELLDYLATELASQGWSLKNLHRLIMTSTVYRQSSVRTSTQDAIDSQNSLYARYPLHRLDAEVIRDRILATSGYLDRKQYGPSVPVVEDAVGQVQAPTTVPRRGVYLQVRRSRPEAFLTQFDAPSLCLNCDRRISSTVATQSLMLMNNDFLLQESLRFAERLRKETKSTDFTQLTAILQTQYPRQGDAWQYGHGQYDGISNRVSKFTPLSHWTGTNWQGGGRLPDTKLGWVLATREGGHPGNGTDLSIIRRWTAPADGKVEIKGKLHHGQKDGDGVRGRIVSSSIGKIGEWTVKERQLETSPPPLSVKTGDTIDLVVDCLANETSDSFDWNVSLTLAVKDQPARHWNSANDFHGPSRPALPQMLALAWQLAYQRPPTLQELELACQFVSRQVTRISDKDPELAALTNLCQQLLSSNEFLYVE